jgi:AraC-like DNA-binding protein
VIDTDHQHAGLAPATDSEAPSGSAGSGRPSRATRLSERRPLPGNDFPQVTLPELQPYDGIREFYLVLEPALMDAISRGDRGEARRLINHVLVHIYSAGQERSDLLKGLLLELVVMMSRAAVAAGSSPSEVLGINFQCLTALAEVNGDEQLAVWLRSTIERIFTAIEGHRPAHQAPVIAEAVRYIRANAHRELTRDETARSVGVSPSHFSYLLREKTGLSYSQLLRQARVDLACELLLTTNESLATIADRCGFFDQSHFTKTFTQAKQLTPRQFRAANRPRQATAAADEGPGGGGLESPA